MTKAEILKEFELFTVGAPGGITNWLTDATDEEVFRRLADIDTNPLTQVQLNQLLVLAHEAPASDDFFRYYWLLAPEAHPYDVKKLPNFDPNWLGKTSIQSLAHLKWGLYRLFVDGLLWF